MIFYRKLQRYWGVVVSLISILLIFSMYKINWNQQPTSRPREQSIEQIVSRVYTGGALDPLNEYIVISNIVTPVGGEISGSGGVNDTIDITICTHSTTNNLHYLPQMAALWEGPISVAVLAYGASVKLALYEMLLLHNCDEGVRRFVSFHLIIPVPLPPVDVYDIVSLPLHCDQTSEDAARVTSKNFEDVHHPYPQNTMRNVAIKNSKTTYVFMIDIDIMPSKHLASHFQTFITTSGMSSKDDKIAYVIPVFEAKTKMSELETKEDLIKEFNAGNVRVYYIDDCPECQETTDYHRWLTTPSSPEPEVMYHANRTYVWEPFYVAKKRRLPSYDGRFKQYGFNRISQVKH